jgi:hypothetical protein
MKVKILIRIAIITLELLAKHAGEKIDNKAINKIKKIIGE